uniref:hypothetical protein n=1 Tax=Streptosporangium sp. CA-115845 TaxID=3240071 RepID=UPI003D93F155
MGDLGQSDGVFQVRLQDPKSPHGFLPRGHGQLRQRRRWLHPCAGPVHGFTVTGTGPTGEWSHSAIHQVDEVVMPFDQSVPARESSAKIKTDEALIERAKAGEARSILIVGVVTVRITHLINQLHRPRRGAREARHGAHRNPSSQEIWRLIAQF